MINKPMTVRTLINKLLDYDKNLPFELVIYGEAGERFACKMKEEDVLENEGHFDSVPIVFSAYQIVESDVEADEAESLQDYINKASIQKGEM